MRGCTLKLSCRSWLHLYRFPFNPHFARMHLETYTQQVVGILDVAFQSSFCEDAPWNSKDTAPTLLINIDFQSSFCEDAPWNSIIWKVIKWHVTFQSSFCEDAPWNRKDVWEGCVRFPLSILILRGCTLKLPCSRSTHWRYSPFNPHFARMHLETYNTTLSGTADSTLSILILRGCTLKPNQIVVNVSGVQVDFQSSFCEDAPWNQS